MSPKKTPEISKLSVEAEIASLAGESTDSTRAPQPDLHSLFSEFFKKQEAQNANLISSIKDSSIQSNRSILSAIGQVLPFPQRNQSETACPSNPSSSVIRQEQSSEEMEMNDYEEVEDDGYSHEDIMNPDFLNFEGWDIPASGTATDPTIEDTPVTT